MSENVNISLEKQFEEIKHRIRQSKRGESTKKQHPKYFFLN